MTYLTSADVLQAHEKGCASLVCELCGGAGHVTYRDGIAYKTHDIEKEEHLIEDCPNCEGTGTLLRQSGCRMRTLEEIRNTPVLLLTPEEIEQLSPEGQEYARLCHSNRARELACTKHEPEGSSTRNGWHNYRCKHCGKNMSYDSGG